MIKQTNLRNSPTEQEYSDIIASKGSGQLNSVNSYLKSDPVSYFYQKFKETGNEFLQDNYWTEAAKRGESENLASLLNSTNSETFDRTAYDTLSGYGDRMDYDSYMLALEVPNLDNTTKVDRFNANGDKIGSYTDREFGLEIVKSIAGKWDAEIIEQDKETRGFLEKILEQGPGAAAATGVTAIGGIMNFLGEASEAVEGAMLVLAGWVDKTNTNTTSQDFLSAYENSENFFSNLGDWLSLKVYDYSNKIMLNLNSTINIHYFY